MYKTIVDAVMHYGEVQPYKIAIADMHNKYTYEELSILSSKIATYIQEIGVSGGDKVIAECTQDSWYIAIDLACELIGAVFVPVEKNAKEKSVRELYENAKAHCIFGQTDYSKVGAFYSVADIIDASTQLERAESTLERNDVAEILFSTGTTGKPKGIVISNRANIAVAQNISYGVEMSKDTVEIVPLPLSHSHGLRTCYANLLNGSTTIIIDGVTNINLFFEMIEQYNVNAIDMSPTVAKLLLKVAKKGLVKISESIRYIEIGTAALDDKVREELKNTFVKSRLYNFYGTTEAGRSCVLNFNEYDATGCIGRPSYHSHFMIVDDNRNPIESSKDNIGLIAVSGNMMMDGYLNDIALTNETVVDGVLYTSDIGYIDENGWVYVLGRRDDVINYKGIKIAPEEIECVALFYEGVKDCACVPKKDAICGQVPKLYIEVENIDEFNMNILKEYLREKLDTSRTPTEIEIIDEIPRTSNGKLLRRSLRDEE